MQSKRKLQLPRWHWIAAVGTGAIALNVTPQSVLAQTSVLAADSASAVSIASPRTGSVATASTWARPHGSAASPSGVGRVQVILQRAVGSQSLSWNGRGWSSKTAFLPATYDASTRTWALSESVAWPSGASLPAGSYRLQAVVYSSGGSVLGRAASSFTVRGATSAGGAVTFDETPTPPGNDLRENAIEIGGLEGYSPSTNVGAGGEGPYGADPQVSNAPNVWWKWTAPPASEGARLFTVNTNGSGFDSMLAVFRVNNGALELVGTADDGGEGAAARVRFAAVPGAEYFISVYGWRGATGNIQLNWRTDFRPVNDFQADAMAISGDAGYAVGTNVDALGQGPYPYDPQVLAAPDVWWKWRAGTEKSQRVTFNTNGSNFDSILAIFRVVNGALEPVIWKDDGGEGSAASATFDSVPGADYLISVYGWRGATGNIQINWRTDYRPLNDARADATAISGNTGSVSGSNVNALGGGPYPYDPQVLAAPDVWWKWRPTSTKSQRVTFNTNGSGFDSILAIFRVINGVPQAVAHADGGGEGSAASVSFDTVPGAEYFVSVYGWRGATGSIKLNWSAADITSVRGRVFDSQNKGVAGAVVYLVPGRTIDPLLFPQSEGTPAYTTTGADGSYSFTNIRAGEYVAVPRKVGFAFAPIGTRLTLPLPATQKTDFRVSSFDTAGPEVAVTGFTLGTLNGATVPAQATGTVRDVSGLPAMPPSGVLVLPYALYRVKSDATSLKLAPGQRGVTAIYSQRARGFVANAGNTFLGLDTVGFATVSGNTWRAAIGPDVQKALSGGTYRLVIFGMDNAFNVGLNARNSTDPNKPAGSQYTYSHFVVRPAKAAVTRTLPISAPNGSLITYAISVSNTGDLPLNNVKVTQNINTAKTILQGTTISPRASAITGTGVVWNVGTIAAHSTKLFTLKVKASDNNPFGSNINAGTLSVTSSARAINFGRDQINIESSTWLIGGFLNALRAVGDSIGSGLSYAFGNSTRDTRAKADLASIKSGSAVTRLAGADALRFGNGVLLVPIGGGNLVAAGGGNLVAAGGGNLVAAGGGNLVAVGGGNLVKIAGLSGANILSQLLSNPSSLLSSTSSFAAALKGTNLVAAGGGNLVAAGGGNLVAAGGGNFLDNVSGQLASTRIKLIGQDSGSLIGNDGGSFTALNGAGVVNVGNGVQLAAGRGNVLISNDSGSFIGTDAASLIGQDGGS